MQLSLTATQFVIDLTGFERLWAFHLGQTITIPLEHIQAVSTELPTAHWSDLRAPGTFLPGVIKAGTYYTKTGREFWYITPNSNYLTLELSPEVYYKKIVLAHPNSPLWVEQIQQIIHHA